MNPSLRCTMTNTPYILRYAFPFHGMCHTMTSAIVERMPSQRVRLTPGGYGDGCGKDVLHRCQGKLRVDGYSVQRYSTLTAIAVILNEEKDIK